MIRLNICVNTQTPLIRFLVSSAELVEKYGELEPVVDLGMLEEGVDFVYSPGGVTAMVYPFLKKMKNAGIAENALWVSLSPGAPTALRGEGIDYINIDLDRVDAEGYVRFKDRLWNEIHGLETLSFIPREYSSFNKYSWSTADVMLQTLGKYDFYYIHDFQQLLVGNFVGPFSPAVYRWHIPANFDTVSTRVRKFIVRNMEAYDAIIVSTKGDLEGLFRAGYKGEAYQVYPSIDTEKWQDPTKEDIDRFYEKTGLKEGDRFFLNVARMDPMKSQDVAIKAMSRLKDDFPDVRLVLIGNGSFSGTQRTGLGSSKSGNWRKHLVQLIEEYNLQDNVLLAGHADDRIVAAAYSLCEAHILTSNREGFGLVTAECWRLKRPVLVSDGCGSAELVIDGLNGYKFRSGSHDDLAAKMILLLKKGRADDMGRFGYETANQCDTDVVMKKELEIFEKVISMY